MAQFAALVADGAGFVIEMVQALYAAITRVNQR